jgi:hypothetical protein
MLLPILKAGPWYLFRPMNGEEIQDILLKSGDMCMEVTEKGVGSVTFGVFR